MWAHVLHFESIVRFCTVTHNYGFPLSPPPLPLPPSLFSPLSFSYVHISKSTRKSLNGDYAVEHGNGGERDDYLKEKNVKTYLIVDKVSRVH